ncbi:hypothetical protein C8Q73DRAFT_708337 [Cubamyces lactineus]|nr:hypothetical protein C8Q73DRAFT_708337 [Cubamyces lactineus]
MMMSNPHGGGYSKTHKYTHTRHGDIREHAHGPLAGWPSTRDALSQESIMQATAPRCWPPRRAGITPTSDMASTRCESCGLRATQAAGAGVLGIGAAAATRVVAKVTEGSRGGALEHRPHLHCLPPRRARGWLGQAELEAGRKPRGGSALSAHARTQGCPTSGIGHRGMWRSVSAACERRGAFGSSQYVRATALTGKGAR